MKNLFLTVAVSLLCLALVAPPGLTIGQRARSIRQATMDELIARRARFEEELFARLRTLFSLQVEMVFYDITSGYTRDTQSGETRRL